MNNQEFRQLLGQIHGKTVLDGVLDKNNLRFKDKEEIWHFIMHYRRDQDNSDFCLKNPLIHLNCPIPPITLKNPQEINTRIIEFQNWGGTLNVNPRPLNKNQHKKEIMIIGESVVGDITQYRNPSYKKRSNHVLNNIPERIVVNLSWGLNLMFQNGNELELVIDYLDEPEKYFWIYLKRLFRCGYNEIINSIYITDIAHCNAEKHKPTLQNCAKQYFLNELFTINPEIILLLGNDAKKAFIRQVNKLNFKIIPKRINLQIDNTFYKEYKDIKRVEFPQAGEIVFEEKDFYKRYKFINIPHPSRAERRYKNDKPFWRALREWLIQFRMIKEPHYINIIKGVLDHGISHLNKLRTPFNFQIAMISIDNAVELMLKAYLGIKYEIGFYSLLQKLKPKLPDGFLKIIPNFLNLDLLIPEWELLFQPTNTQVDFLKLIQEFHEIRNNLYHNVIKENIRRKVVVTYAALAKFLFNKLLVRNKDKNKISEKRQSILKNKFLEIWRKIEDRIKLFFLDIMDINYDYDLLFALDVLLHEHMIDIETDINLIILRILKKEIKKGFEISWERLQKKIDFLIDFESKLDEKIDWYYENEEPYTGY